MSRPLLLLLAFALPICFLPDGARADLAQDILRHRLPELPIAVENAFEAKMGDTLVVAGGVANSAIYALLPGAGGWERVGDLGEARSHGGVAVDGDRMLLIGGRRGNERTAEVTSLILTGGTATLQTVAQLPEALAEPAATVHGGKLYIAGGATEQGPVKRFIALDLSDSQADWETLPPWRGSPRQGSYLFHAVESFYLMGGVASDGAPVESESYHPQYGWKANLSDPPSPILSLAKVGDAHVMTLNRGGTDTSEAYLYHTIGDTWVALDEAVGDIPAKAQLVGSGTQLAIIANDAVESLAFGNPKTNYGWRDHLAVAFYFGLMIYVGFHFTKRKSSTEAYFRGSHTIPWWATGMSLFATAASALSLLAMPGKSYSTNWTFFAITLYTIIALPASMFLLAPLVRKLNFATAFEYLEHRFGLIVRMFGSGIFVLQQILGRMGPVMLLPSIAMAAITGMDIKTCIVAMGVVTTLYTFLGGLSAVIWTDTIQGIVMVIAVFGCLLLILFRIDMSSGEIWSTLQDRDKLHVFDWGWSPTQSNVATMLIGLFAITLFSISDQNYVQRVQCTRTLSDAKKAIATQIAVAAPINILLFALGSALYLFYRQQPAVLNPVMATDGVFPFFAAQQLPPGVSGLVVAALLAATMSTISSSICSVSNLGVDDFYRRFVFEASDTRAVIVGRALTVVVGMLGIAAALFLSEFKTPSIWDLALLVINFITSTTLGIFALGLLTTRANEKGVVIGIVAGLLATYLIQTHTEIIFWLYPVLGSAVTFAVGYAASLATGGNRKLIDGLTVYTLQNRKNGLDD